MLFLILKMEKVPQEIKLKHQESYPIPQYKQAFQLRIILIVHQQMHQKVQMQQRQMPMFLLINL